VNPATPFACPEVLTEVHQHLGCITLNRPQALNALSLSMVRALTTTLLAWRDDPQVQAVAIRGMGKQGPFGVFCAGGDIRFFHAAALRADAELEDFFTEEYRLNHLLHQYPKPRVAFMDGVVMGGGMGLAQGASVRLVTPRSTLAMPETQIGFFPDVGAGHFLSRCPHHAGSWLALSSASIGASDALDLGLADACIDHERLEQAWHALRELPSLGQAELQAWQRAFAVELPPCRLPLASIERCFSQTTVETVWQALTVEPGEWAQQTRQAMQTHSPLMQAVSFELLRRGKDLTLADDLRLERNLVRHCFQTRHLGRFQAATETVEGIRALAIDKDRQPRWWPARREEVTTEMVQGFFVPPWPAQAHPLRDLD